MKTNREENEVASTSLHGFVRRLYMLRRSYRATSQPRDYVLAVWPDCPGYKVPEEKSGEEPMTLAELLQDAISQMLKNFGFSIYQRVSWALMTALACGDLKGSRRGQSHNGFRCVWHGQTSAILIQTELQ